MAQSVYNIPDSSGVDFLTNINAVLGAIQTINSGATPPTDTQSGMWWGDISNPNTFYLKMRNHTNNGWVSLYAYDVATGTIRALSNDKYLAEITGATGAVFLPSGTTAQRPTLTSGERALRYNTDNAELEFWDGTAWDSVGGGLDINSLTDKTTPDNTDNMALQETGGLLKKLSFANLKLWILSLFNPSLTGTVSFDSTTNNINLTNIVTALGLDIGDVIQIGGAEDTKNNSEFTVDVITDANNIIVNQAHANKGTTKNVANRAGDTNVTVKLLAKWHNADSELGRDWVDVKAIRAFGTTYSANKHRDMQFKISFALPNIGGSQGGRLLLNGVDKGYIFANSTQSGGTHIAGTGFGTITRLSNYLIQQTGTATIQEFWELR